MSYSRWTNSDWYTFWCVHPQDSIENRDTAIFDICTVCQFSAKELRDDMDACVAKAVELSDNDNDGDELKECMQEFLRDVDERYPRSSHEQR